MFITGITHADARGKELTFRGLTQQGWGEAFNAAVRFKVMFDARKTSEDGEIPIVQSAISSPKPRCLETAILFAKMLSDYDLIAASEVQIDPGLRAGSIQGDELAKLAGDNGSDHLLVSGHADLAKTLPATAKLDPESIKDGWFTARPIVFTLSYEPGQPWDSAELFFCEGYVEGEWKSLLAG